MQAVETAADKTSHKVMVAFNLTGEIDEMRHRHDFVKDQGGTCVMASVNSVGMSGMIELARHSELPIHAHRAGWGALTRETPLRMVVSCLVKNSGDWSGLITCT